MPLVNFPTYTSRFIGRETDATVVAQAMQQQQLVSLVGTSGTGKTRLSQQIAQQLEPHFPDGCVFISLAAIYEASLVLPTIATSLEIKLIDDTSPFEHIQTKLATKRLLLVLDNIEQVTEAAPELVNLLDQCPHIHMLVTTQEPLHVAQEQVIRIPPLNIPPTTEEYTAQELIEFPAVALFVDRLKAIQPHFQLTQQTMPLVKEICQRLYGLPLALELVAANSRQMPLRDVLLLLRNYLPPVDPSVPLRRSDIIQPVLDWCYRIMPPALQRVYPQLGVFHGGWTQTLADQVCKIVQPGLTIEGVHRWLEARHLVLAEALADGSLRYSMVDAVVEDARRRLAATTDYHQHQLCYAETWATYTTQGAERVKQAPESVESWFQALKYERANIRATLNWSLEQQRFPLAARIGHALSRFWMTHGDVHEAQQWLEHTLENSAELEPEQVASLNYGIGLIYFRLGRYDQAQQVWEQSVAWYQAHHETTILAALWNGLAGIASQRGDFATSRGWLAQAREIHQQRGNRASEALTVSNMGLSFAHEGRFEDARQTYELALELLEGVTADHVLCLVVGNLGCCYVELEHYTTAIPLLEQSIAIYEKTGNLYYDSIRRNLALAYLRLNQLHTAYPRILANFKQSIATTNTLETAHGLAMAAEWFWSTNHHQGATEAWQMATCIYDQLGIPVTIHNKRLQRMIQELELHNQTSANGGFQQHQLDQLLVKLTGYLQTHPYSA